jgi:anti-anti-sigma regulatory factor
MVRYTCDERTGIKTVSKMKADILLLMAEGDDLSIDMVKVRRIDCAVGQLLIATQKEGKARGIAVRLTGISPEVKRQLSLCGVIKRGVDI